MPFPAPTPRQTLLLRACLLDRPRAESAWTAWLNDAPHPLRELGRHRGGARRLLPLLYHARERFDLPAEKELRTYLRTAFARDELRYATCSRILRNTVRTLDAAGFSFILLKGAALAETVYHPPSLRHSHDIDILVRAEDLYAAARCLEDKGFIPSRRQLGPARLHLQLHHASGLPVVLHTNLFRLPFYTALLDTLWVNTQWLPLGDTRVRTSAPADTLLLVCGHAATSSSRLHLAWVCDASLLLRHTPNPDWNTLLDTAYRTRMTLPLAGPLRYLRDELDAPIPDRVFDQLAAWTAETGAAARDTALFAAQDGAWRKLASFFQMEAWRSRRLFWWLLVPPAPYLAWAYKLERRWLIPLYYLWHTALFLAGFLRRAVLSH